MPRTLHDQQKGEPVITMNPPPTGTPTNVVVPAEPAKYAIAWNTSLKFRSYVSAELLLLIGWLIENLSTHSTDFHSWTWIAVSVSTLTLLAAVVRDWADPAVIAPFAAMNANNYPTVR